MATQTKAQFLGDVLTLLKKRYKMSASTQKFTVLEAVVYGICHEDATRSQADHALEKFKTGFFDWNEVRVSSISEIQGVFEGLKIPGAEERATKLRRFLRQMFEKSYGFNLEPLTKKPLKDSIKLLQEYEALSSDFVLATVTRLALGGHAIGIDIPTRRALERMAVTETGVDSPTLRGTLERAVPKTRGVEFVDLIEELAHDTCVENDPDCNRCELKKVCPKVIAAKVEPPVSKLASTSKNAGKASGTAAQSPGAPGTPTKTGKGKPASTVSAAKGPAGGKAPKTPAAPVSPPAAATKSPSKDTPAPAKPTAEVKPPAKPVAKSNTTPAEKSPKASGKPASDPAQPLPAASKPKKPDKSK